MSPTEASVTSRERTTTAARRGRRRRRRAAAYAARMRLGGTRRSKRPRASARADAQSRPAALAGGSRCARARPRPRRCRGRRSRRRWRSRVEPRSARGAGGGLRRIGAGRRTLAAEPVAAASLPWEAPRVRRWRHRGQQRERCQCHCAGRRLTRADASATFDIAANRAARCSDSRRLSAPRPDGDDAAMSSDAHGSFTGTEARRLLLAKRRGRRSIVASPAGPGSTDARSAEPIRAWRICAPSTTDPFEAGRTSTRARSRRVTVDA